MAVNKQNLKPFTSEQSREKAVENGRKGGIKSGEAKRERKLIREMFEERLAKNGYRDIDEWLINLAERAKVEDKSMELAISILGEKPAEKLDLTQDKPFEIKVTVDGT